MIKTPYVTVELTLDRIASELQTAHLPDVARLVNKYSDATVITATCRVDTEISFLLGGNNARITYVYGLLPSDVQSIPERIHTHKTSDGKSTILIEAVAGFTLKNNLGVFVSEFYNALLMLNVIKPEYLIASVAESNFGISESDKELLDRLDSMLQEITMDKLVKLVNRVSGSKVISAVHQSEDYVFLYFNEKRIIYSKTHSDDTETHELHIHKSPRGEWAIDKTLLTVENLFNRLYRQLDAVLNMSVKNESVNEDPAKMKTIRLDIIDQETNETTTERFDVAVKSSFTNHMIMLMIRGLLSQLK